METSKTVFDVYFFISGIKKIKKIISTQKIEKLKIEKITTLICGIIFENPKA